jgi:hypothetical protein
MALMDARGGSIAPGAGGRGSRARDPAADCVIAATSNFFTTAGHFIFIFAQTILGFKVDIGP